MGMKAEWSDEDIAAAKERIAASEARGVCPYSGYGIGWCWRSELCDCAYAPPFECTQCPVVCWDLVDHERRYHP